MYYLAALWTWTKALHRQDTNSFLNKVRALSPDPGESIRPTILLQLIFLDEGKLRLLYLQLF